MRAYTTAAALAALLILQTQPGLSVAQPGFSSAGAEVQAYPAGVILGVRTEWQADEHNALNLRLGYNIARRGDYGKHDNEEGGGPGFSIGYRRYLHGWLPGLFAGIRSDLWRMDIDWRDDLPAEITGTTEITVVQPTVEAGYDLLKPNSAWRVVPTISFGYEINVDTEGEPVGEGAILLGGVNIGLRL